MQIRKQLSRSLIKRALKPIPIIGTGAVIAFAAGTIRRKGMFKGSADVLLDLLPIVGLTKTVVEVFTGDLIPDKQARS
jgi:hypothetical protein